MISAGRSRARGTVTLVLGAAVTVAAVAAVLSSAGGVGDVVGALGRVSAGWTLAALAATPLGYALLAVHLRRLSGGRVSIWRAARADLLLFGLGNLLPGSPAPGALLAGRALRRDGLSPARTRLVLTLTLWFNVRSLLGLGALAFLVAAARQHPGLRSSGLLWLVALAVILSLAATATLAARPGTARRGALLAARLRPARRRRAPASGATRATAEAWHAEAKAAVGSPRHRALLVALAAGSWLADAACLGLALAAAGTPLEPDILMLVYVTGIAISALPLLPGGIGAVEAAVPVLAHHFGAPLDAALAGTLVYRGISTLLPATAGALLLATAALGARGRALRGPGERPTADPQPADGGPVSRTPGERPAADP